MKKRNLNEIRKVSIETGVNKYAEGSCLIKMGDTHVLCTCTIEQKVPRFKVDSGEGWVTAEYSMLPRATHYRNQRESQRGKQSGRTLEIQRLIGRSLRSIINLSAIDGFSFTIDCDVIQADGGTRTASITGGFVALSIAINTLLSDKKIEKNPILKNVAAISLGLIGDDMQVDLDYELDSKADVDLNLVMTNDLEIVEVQGTAEKTPFTQNQLNDFVTLGSDAILKLVKLQNQVIEGHDV
ncbi:MAG: ribonuclease PH [Candidatus Cloacimonadota bacterium]|nr:MAG: ribonuclease PH [Candidatus Cloacimonadota bacterium]